MADVTINKFRASVVRDGSKPASPGFIVSEGQDPVDPSGSGQNHLPVTIGSPANGLAVTDAQILTIDKAQIFAGTSSQFVKGDGTLDSNTYLTTGSASATYVPYTGATADVNLGTHDLAAERGTFANNGSSDSLTVNHTSGSGYGIIVTKGGNNEALYVSKTSGSGNAMTVVGGRTSLVDLALSSVTNTAGDFLTLSGGVVHKRTAAQTLTDIGGQAALTNPVTGTGTSGQVAYFSGTSAISSESNLFWDATNDRLGINNSLPAASLDVSGTALFTHTSGYGINNKYTSENLQLFFGTVIGGKVGIQAKTISTSAAYTLYLNPDGGGIEVNGNGKFLGSSTVTAKVLIESGNQWSLNADQSGAGTPAFAGSGFYLKNENTSTIALGFDTGGAATFISSVKSLETIYPTNKASGFSAFSIFQNGNKLTVAGGTGGIQFNDNANTTPLLNIFNNGRVYIGSVPSDSGFKLDVDGTGRYKDALTANTFVEIVGDLRFNSNSADRSIYFRGIAGSPDTNWKMGTYLNPTGATTVTLAATVIDVFGGASGYGFMVRNTSNSPLLQIAGDTGAATFSSSVTTGAPAGGTAQPWKLGTVATVSPTSPNRTIEVEVNGTTYYLHAKTTNN